MDTNTELGMGRMVVVPESTLADLIELSTRALDALEGTQPALRAALCGAIAEVRATGVVEP